MLTITELIDAVEQLIDRKPGHDSRDIDQRIDVGIEYTSGRKPDVAFSIDLIDRSRFGLRILSATGDTTDELLRRVSEQLFPASTLCSEDDLNESLNDFLEE